MAVYYPRCLVLIQPVFEDFESLGPEEGTSGSIEAIPLAAEWTASPPHEADEATVRLSWRELPLDPRTIRSARILIYAADVEDPAVDLYVGNDAVVRFIGFVDEPSSTLGDGGGEVTLRARDYSGRLMSTPWIGESVEVDRPLSTVVSAVIKASGVAGYADVATSLPDGDPKLSDILGKTRWTPGGKSAWDVINELARVAGMTAEFRLDTLLLQKPVRVQDRPVATFLYGENVASLAFRRNLNPVARKAVKVRAYDARARQVREVTFPDDGKAPGGTINLLLPQGAWSKDALTAWAEGYYNALGQEEMRGTLDTVVMRDSAEADAFDLLGLRTGDVLSVRLRTEKDVTVQGMTRGEVVSYLESRGLKRSVAEALADAWLDAETLATVYAVSRATHRWDHDGGYALSIDFRTFLTPKR